MDLFDSVKMIYKDSSENILLTDANLNVIWKNQDALPDSIHIERITIHTGKIFTLPSTKTFTAEYKSASGRSCAIRIEPLRKDDIIVGYLIHIYTCEDIELLGDRSGYLDVKSNFVGNIRNELTSIVAMLDTQRHKYESMGDLDYLRFDKNTRFRLLKTLSATVNMTELTKYYSGNYNARYENISYVISDAGDDVSELFYDNGCEFSYSAEPCIFVMTNSDRLKYVIYNLIINSLMYNRKDKKVCELSLATKDDKAIITVYDNGNGIENEVWEKSIKPFGNFKEYSEHESLGLALANCYCKRFGCKLILDTKLGEYTKITIEIPYSPDNTPKIFHSPHLTPLRMPYDTQYCILAKGINPMK